MTASFTEMFSAALTGSDCYVVGLHDEPAPIPTDLWTGTADDVDQSILNLCTGPTLDIGCGPGRMAAALAQRGQIVLGIDVVAEAVAQTKRRGAVALRRNVFGRLPAEGRWQTTLLADGNVGIGGDPEALLRRTRELLVRRGRVVVEVAAPGVTSRTVWAALECGVGRRSRPFRWSVVGVDDLAALARDSGFRVLEVAHFGSRWFGILTPEEAP